MGGAESDSIRPSGCEVRMKATSAAFIAIAGLALSTSAMGVGATSTATPARADCFGYPGDPIDCPDPFLSGTTPPSQRSDYPPSQRNDYAFLAAVTPMVDSPNGFRVLIQLAHAICADLARGTTSDQEAT